MIWFASSSDMSCWQKASVIGGRLVGLGLCVAVGTALDGVPLPEAVSGPGPVDPLHAVSASSPTNRMPASARWMRDMCCAPPLLCGRLDADPIHDLADDPAAGG